MNGEYIIKQDDGSARVTQRTRWHSNLDQDNVVTTEDKIRICLMTYLGRIESRNTWHTPLGIVLALGLTFLTADFKHFYFSADTWRAFFFFALLSSFIWLIVTLRRRQKAITIEEVVKKLKNEEDLEMKTS